MDEDTVTLEDCEVEIYIPARDPLFNADSDEECITLMPVEITSGTPFEEIEALLSWGEEDYVLTLTWSPSRAGRERIPYSTLDGKAIDITKHPLFNTKNEQEGLYHPTLKSGCYRIKACVQL